MSDDDIAVSPISELDHLYNPPPSFEEWARAATIADDNVLTRYLRALEKQREIAPPDILERIIRTAIRTAAVDTGALEGLYEVDRGFTYTVAAEEATWEAVLEEKGPNAKALIDAQLKTYELVLDASTKRLDLSEAWIRRLHEELCKPQGTYEVRTPQGPKRIPLPLGKYKSYPNHVLQADGTEHAYAPVNDTQSEMARVVRELRSRPFTVASPVAQAAYAHYALVAVHPFADGNGRVARALASVFTYRALSIPLVIYADQRQPYLGSLRAADGGDPQAFVTFVRDRVLDSVAEVTQELRTASRPAIEDAVTALEQLNVGCGGLIHAELDAVAARVLTTLHDLFRERLEAASRPPISYGVQFRGGSNEPPSGYRVMVGGGAKVLQVLFASVAPTSANAEIDIQVAISTLQNDDFCLILQRLDEADEPIEIRLADAYPVVVASLRRRMSSWVEQLIADKLVALRAAARNALRQAGYPVSDQDE